MSSALASLALAEATLIVVLKDDPYAAAVADDRNKDNKDWMISAPSIPKVRAHLFARLSLAASDHAAKAAGLMARTGPSGKIDDDLLKYTQDLRRTARGKAARFLGIDAEISGKAGEGIAWLRGAKRELGLAVGGDDDAGRRKGLKGLKQSWSERKEDKRIVKATEDWGMDAGRLEEARVVEWLEAKCVRSNDMVSYALFVLERNHTDHVVDKCAGGSAVRASTSSHAFWSRIPHAQTLHTTDARCRRACSHACASRP